MHCTSRWFGGVAAAMLVAVMFGTPRVHAQAAAAATTLTPFVGEWTLGLDTPQGAATMNLSLKDQGGKVVGVLSSDAMPTQDIVDIALEGNNLVMRYSLDFQGQAIPAQITLIPVEDKWKANFDFADGQFNVDGTAAKK
jgi:hypothetical protein